MISVLVVPAFTVDVGFCGAHDHILIGFGGNRFGIYPERRPDEEGFFAKLELWALEEDVEDALNRVIYSASDRSFLDNADRLLEVSLRGWKGEQILKELGASPELVAETKARLVEALRDFRANGGDYLLAQTARWHSIRRPSSRAP